MSPRKKLPPTLMLGLCPDGCYRVVGEQPPRMTVRLGRRDSPRCEHCGGRAELELLVDVTGGAMGSDYQHRPDCKTLFCEHGVPHREECLPCEERWSREHREEMEDG